MSDLSLRERLDADMKTALKAGEQGRVALSVIRLARAAIKNAEIDRGHVLQENEIVEILARELKQRHESRVEFVRGGRTDLVGKTDAEIQVLQTYLPEPLSTEAVREIARQVIAAVGATSAREFGKVMPGVIAETKGRADGKLVSDIVRELLS